MRALECCIGLFALLFILFCKSRFQLLGEMRLLFDQEQRDEIFKGQTFSDWVFIKKYRPYVDKKYCYYYFFIILAYIILSIVTVILQVLDFNKLIVGIPLSLYFVLFLTTYHIKEVTIKDRLIDLGIAIVYVFFLLKNFHW